MGDSSTLSLSLECIFGSTFPQWGPFSRIQSWELICCWDHLGSVLNWTQLRPLCKLLRFQWVRAKIYLPYRHQNIFLCKFPCLLNLYLPIRNYLPLSSVCPCLPCREVSFRFHPGRSQGFKSTIHNPARRPNGVGSNPKLVISPCVGRVDHWMSVGQLHKPAGLMCLFEELLQSGGMNGYIVGGSYYEQVCGGHWCLIRGWLSR